MSRTFAVEAKSLACGGGIDLSLTRSQAQEIVPFKLRLLFDARLLARRYHPVEQSD